MKIFFQLFVFISLAGTSFAQDDHPSTVPAPSQEVDRSERNNQHNEYPGIFDIDLPDVSVEKIERESDTFQSKFLNMLFILALLIGFMILASWSLKRLMRTKVSQLNTTNTIKILETRYLSPRATLYLLEIQDQTILIAESPTAVSFLSTMPKEDFREEG